MSFPAPPPIGLETMGEVHDVVVPGMPVGGRLAEAERAVERRARGPATSAAASDRASLAGCALLGLAAGHRSMAPLAVLALARPRARARARRGVALPIAVAMLAAVELVVDKLPFVPPRTRAFPAVVRALSGAVAGAVAAHRARRWAVGGAVIGGPAGGAAHHARQWTIGGAVIGGAAAIAATELGLRLRLAAEDSMPAVLAGLVEDVLAVSMAYAGASLARPVGEPAERVRHGMSQGRESIDVRVSG